MIYLKEFATQAEYDAFVESGEMDKPNVSYIADSVTVLYHTKPAPPPLGVYIQHIDGTYYTEEEWANLGYSNDLANGVAVVAENAKFVINKNWSLKNQKWSSALTVVEGIPTTTALVDAIKDFNGLANTAVIVAAVGNDSAAKIASATTFPNGNKGYLPSVGECRTLELNRAAVDSAMSLIGGTAVTGSFWTSTQVDADKAWSWTPYYKSAESDPKTATRNVRAFTTLD